MASRRVVEVPTWPLMVMSRSKSDLDFLAMDSLVNDALHLFRFHSNGSLLEQIVKVRSFEETIPIHGIAMHREFATGSPIANRVVVDAKVLGSFGGVQVFRQFGHGFGLNTLGANFARAVA